MSDKLTIPEQPITEHTLIGEAGTRYECVTREAVVAYIVDLTRRIRGTDARFVRLLDVYEKDRDSLIELHAAMTDG